MLVACYIHAGSFSVLFCSVFFFTIYLCFENEMPTIKEFESILDSKLQPIQAKLDDLVQLMNDN